MLSPARRLNNLRDRYSLGAGEHLDYQCQFGSCRGDVLLDPFAGSGTTLIAAQRTGRTARLIEIDPKYADVIVKR